MKEEASKQLTFINKIKVAQFIIEESTCLDFCKLVEQVIEKHTKDYKSGWDYSITHQFLKEEVKLTFGFEIVEKKFKNENHSLFW